MARSRHAGVFSGGNTPNRPMSTAKRILALVVIFIFATIAWMILGATIFQRTYDQDSSLRSKVSSTWGSPQVQSPPSASFEETIRENQDFYEHGRTVTRLVKRQRRVDLGLLSTRASASIQLEHRQKGLLWYSTYQVLCSGRYAFRNPSPAEQTVTFSFPFPAGQAIYDGVTFAVDGAPVSFKNENNAGLVTVPVAAGKTVVLTAGYSSQGMDRWSYRFSDQIAQVRDFQLTMVTNFKDIDFPDNTLSPSEKHETADGWKLDWNYKDLLTGYEIGMIMPEKLQP